MWKEYIIKRDELYEKVWTRPMVDIAKEYEVSDKAIAKICDKLNVPVPGIGYWRKVEVGENLLRKKLPDIPPTHPTEHRISKEVPDYDLIISDEAQKSIDEEKDPSNKIIVPAKRTNTHWLIKKTELSLSTTYRAKNFLSSSNEEGVFNLYVSSGQLSRALRIIDTVIKTLERRGYLVYIKDGFLCVKMFSMELSFKLREKSKRIEKTQDGTYSYKEYDFLSTGILSLSIEDFYTQHPIQRNFADIKSRKVEDRLNEFIIGLIFASQAKIAKKLYWEKERKIRDEEERIREEKVRAIENEKRKIKILIGNVKRYHKSNLIREYMAQYKLNHLDETVTSEKRKEIMGYIEWALKQADRIDPFIENPPSILDSEISGKYDSTADEFWKGGRDE